MSAIVGSIIGLILLSILWLIIHVKTRLLGVVFGIITHFLLFILINSFINKNGNIATLSSIENKRLQQTGYYINSESQEAVFTKYGVAGGFTISNLGRYDSIVLRPIWDTLVRHRIASWELFSLVGEQPLRLDSRCINVPTNQWLNINDSLVIINL